MQQRFAAFLMDYESQDLNTTTQSNNDQTGGSLKSGGFKVSLEGDGSSKRHLSRCKEHANFSIA